MNPEDELTAEDMDFLNRWQNAGKDKNADKEYAENAEDFGPIHDGPESESEGDSGFGQGEGQGDIAGGGSGGDGDEGESGPEGDSPPPGDDEQPEGESEPQNESESPDEGQDDKGDDAPENETDHDQSDDSQSDDSGQFDNLPEADPKCENHCEDNPHDGSEGEVCEHCQARIAKERELWGPIALDKNGVEILPGDKVRVVIPISFMMHGTLLTANVPNLECDPIRVAESTAKEVDDSLCWLSGQAISQFTGWHMQGDGPIWTFPCDKNNLKKIGFVEKVGEFVEHHQHGDNMHEGDQQDMEDIIEDFKKQLDEHDKPEEKVEEGPSFEERIKKEVFRAAISGPQDQSDMVDRISEAILNLLKDESGDES